jgi:zinc transport system substrate-binding protein
VAIGKYLKSICFGLILTLGIMSGCGAPQEGNEIAVTIEPQRYFAEHIAGSKFGIHSVVPSGQSPEVYDPTPQEMLRTGKSRAYLRMGYLGFEQVWMKSIQENNPKMQVFDLSEGIDLIKDDEEDDDDEHNHHQHPGGIDPHTWSSIKGAKVIARNTLNAFITLDKENEEYYRHNYESLMAEIEATEAYIHRKLDTLTHRAFIIYHPALTYFADEFNLVQLSIEMDGKEPSPIQLKTLVDMAKEHQVKVVFVQQEFDRKNAERIAEETGCRLVTINLLDYHWDKEMINVANALAGE